MSLAPITRSVVDALRAGATQLEVRIRFGLSSERVRVIKYRYEHLIEAPLGRKEPASEGESLAVGAAPGGPPPPPPARSRIFPVLAHARWPNPRDVDVREAEELELGRVDLGVRAVLVPGGCVPTGDRAWRREVSC